MKIAIIHNNAQTGASAHAYMLAQQLQEKINVSFLVINLVEKGMNFTDLKDVKVFHYTVEQKYRMSNKWPLVVSLTVRLRILLFKLNLLQRFDNITWLWKTFRTIEKKWFNRAMPLPLSLCDYIIRHDYEYDAYVILGNFSGPAFYMQEKYSHKTILIPLVHLEMPQFILSVHDITSHYQNLAYNTLAEKELCEEIHGKNPYSEVIGCGIKTIATSNDEWQKFQEEHALQENYLLYVGRLTRRKTGKLFKYFIRYKKIHPSSIKLVIAGDNYMDKKTIHPDIIYLGYVTEADKYELIQHAAIILNPSTVESLSLIVLEAMHSGIPVLVNGRCKVLRDHCEQSNGGFAYTDYHSFETALTRLLSDVNLRKTLGENGHRYEQQNYSWPIITQKWIKLIEHVSNITS